MNHFGCGQTIDEVSGIVIMLKSTRGQSVPVHLQRVPVTPEQKSGSGQSVPVHFKRVPVHLSRKVTVAKVYRYTIKVYRYTCMKITGIEWEFDPNVRAHLSINLEGEITLERSI